MLSGTDVLSLVDRRPQLLARLNEGTATKQELKTTLGVSRSTVDRAINELERAQLIDRSDRAYTLTLRGRIAYREFRRTVDRYDSLSAATSLLEHLPETTELPGVLFDNTTVILPSSPAPETPRTEFVNRVRQSEVVVGTSTVVNQRLVEVFDNQLTAHDLQLSLLLDKQVVEYLRDAHHDTLCTALATDRCTLQSIEQTPPFNLTIVNWTDLWLGVHDDCGRLQGVLHTESAAAVEWAEQYLQEYTEQATPICLRDRERNPPDEQSSS
jgi:predicted transcriptional regulator